MPGVTERLQEFVFTILIFYYAIRYEMFFNTFVVLGKLTEAIS